MCLFDWLSFLLFFLILAWCLSLSLSLSFCFAFGLSFLLSCRPYLVRILALGWAVWPMLYVGPMLAYVGPTLSHLGGYVGICWLSRAYVGDMLGNLC